MLAVDEVTHLPVRDLAQDRAELLVLGVNAEGLVGLLADEHRDLDEVDTLALVQVLHHLPGDDSSLETSALFAESSVLCDGVLTNFLRDAFFERNEHDVPVHWRISSRVTLHYFSYLSILISSHSKTRRGPGVVRAAWVGRWLGVLLEARHLHVPVRESEPLPEVNEQFLADLACLRRADGEFGAGVRVPLEACDECVVDGPRFLVG